jgi:DNA-binding PadR family transcriptional regulator
MHGYRLNQAVQDLGFEHWTTLSRSSIYGALRRLARQGAVSVTKEREGSAPERTVYHITEKGRKMLGEILRHALGYVGPEDRYFYLGLMFAEALPGREIVNALESRCARLQEQAAGEEEEMQAHEDADPPMKHLVEMMRAGFRHFEVELEVCRNLIELLRQDPNYFERIREVMSHELE